METTQNERTNTTMVATQERTLLLLDYDGTLVEFADKPENVNMDRQMLEVLKAVSQNEKYRTVIITGRDRQDIEKRLEGLDVEIVAEHGAFRRENGIWQSHIEENLNWKGLILPVLIEYTLKCPHAFVEEKSVGYAWHYRSSPPKRSMKMVPDLLEELGPYLKKYNLKAIHGNKVIEILPNNVSKGRASIMLMQEEDYGSVIAIGDDRTDEETFLALQPFAKCHTMKVGGGESLAKQHLQNITEVLGFLKSLT